MVANVTKVGHEETEMKREQLGIYLNDHLAGALAALNLITHLIETYKGQPLAGFFEDLQRDIVADEEKLKQLIAAAGAEESSVRKAGAWIAEKLGRAKLSPDETKADSLALLEALEGLALGIRGKELLWLGFAAAPETIVEFPAFNFELLAARAAEQRERVEAKRVAVVRELFAQT